MEVLNLTFRDLILPSDVRFRSSDSNRFHGGLLIAVAKTGTHQYVPFYEGRLLEIFHRWCLKRRLKGDDLVFPVNYFHLTDEFR